ncbi:fluoride efflux transporter CrcB [Candidatus Thiosymbion oneisti]|uniref:fluoride efflux transporter CrcB n=1 Tax=Candidatus Thiosymbion oneisti TaxID=589554 RepID=UPI00159F11DD|nr:fluoride efflux transporter CrcB [Candidatus Thiosymbion oneisti]
MLQILAIAGGGALGALGRFWMSSGVYRLLGRDLPWGTLVVNTLGSFLMGLLFVLFMERSTAGPELRAAVLVGFLGAFTTFSTFSMETLALIEGGYPGRALLNLVLSVLVCVLACWVGLLLGRWL